MVNFCNWIKTLDIEKYSISKLEIEVVGPFCETGWKSSRFRFLDFAIVLIDESSMVVELESAIVKASSREGLRHSITSLVCSCNHSSVL